MIRLLQIGKDDKGLSYKGKNGNKKAILRDIEGAQKDKGEELVDFYKKKQSLWVDKLL